MDSPFSIDEPKSLFNTHRIQLLDENQRYRDQYTIVIIVLRYVQITRNKAREEQVLIGEREPLSWYKNSEEIDEL